MGAAEAVYRRRRWSSLKGVDGGKVFEVPGAREVRLIFAEVGDSKAPVDRYAVRKERDYGLQVRVVDLLCGGGGEKEEFIRWKFNSALSGFKGFGF